MVLRAKTAFKSNVGSGNSGYNPTDYGGAAATTLPAILKATRENSPDYGNVATTGVVTQAQVRGAAMGAGAATTEAGITALGNAKTGQMQARASLEIADKQIKQQQEEAAAKRADWAKTAFSGAIQIGATLLAKSDERMKHTINEIEQATSLLRGLRPVTFYYKEEYSDMPKRKHYGFIAQEYERLMPDATYTLGDDDMKGINMQELIALLVSSNQELESRIRRLEVKEALKPVVAGATR